MRSGGYNADDSAADSVGDATNKSDNDAADNASDDATDDRANASSAILADGVAAAVLVEDVSEDADEDAAEDPAEDVADNAAGNASVGRTTSIQTLRDIPLLLPFNVLPSCSIEMLRAASNNIFEIPEMTEITHMETSNTHVVIPTMSRGEGGDGKQQFRPRTRRRPRGTDCSRRRDSRPSPRPSRRPCWRPTWSWKESSPSRPWRGRDGAVADEQIRAVKAA